MSSANPSVPSATKVDHIIVRPGVRPAILSLESSRDVWRNVRRQAISRIQPKSLSLKSVSRTYSFLYTFREPRLLGKFQVHSSNESICQECSRGVGEIWNHMDYVGKPGFGVLRSSDNGGCCTRGYAGVAEAVSSLTDVEEEASVGDEVQQLIQEMRKDHKREVYNMWRERRKIELGICSGKYQRLRRRQVKIEAEAWEQAANEYEEILKDMFRNGLAPHLPYTKTLFLGWYEPLRDAIAKEQKLIRERMSKPVYAPYFTQLPAEMMAVITMHKLMAAITTGLEYGCTKVTAVACVLGDAIEQEVRIQKFLEKTKTKKEDKRKKGGGGDSEALMKVQEKLSKKVIDLIKKQKLPAVKKIVNGQDDSKPWGLDARAKVGSRLIDLLIQTAYIQPPIDQLVDSPPDIRPAFVHRFRTEIKENRKCRRYGVIECDQLVLKGLEKTARHMVIPYMPMLVPPVKWTGYDKGGYLLLPSHLMRIRGARQQREALKRTPREQLQPVFEALDTLGSTRWRVNKRVLSVVERIWNSGGGLANLVDCCDVPLPELPDTEDEGLLKKWRWEVKSIKKENMERHSQRCDVELKLAVARKMKDEEGFYYPHNLDFRGRAYPMHPNLNHLGSDLCRGVLEFAEGRPLGKSGMRWLKIHLANLFAGGVDKLSYEGRIAFTENHLDDIFDSADQPLEGKRWWLRAEDPFQCLAVCFHLREALRSPSLETLISHIPIHQDGSCNGLQHYAALGRDQLGADAVNLVAGEKPADVYSGIAARVLDIMKTDAQKDPANFPDALHAKILVNQVDRKLVKQTVMTSVYGVTFFGAREQIKRRLKERGFAADYMDLFSASCYTARVTLTALGEMFEAARSIMNWLGECAKIIASENEPVRWTTPLGLPVVQPYRQSGIHHVSTSLQVLILRQETEKVMIKRQRTAFTPNFIHSLDASHMMMTAVACKRAGLRFAGVHDSYWTHACDVDEMNRILRQKFVELYEQPILENLLESFQQSFPALSFPPMPARGDFVLRDVLKSPYFFN